MRGVSGVLLLLWLGGCDPSPACGNAKREEGELCYLPAQSFSVGVSATALLAADVNQDGAPDLITANQTTNNVSIFLGDGGGFTFLQTSASGAQPIALLAADVDNDLLVDIVTADAGGLSVLFGDGAGSFAAPLSLPVSDAPVAVKALDLNNDGDLDLVSVNPVSGDLSVLLGSGGSFLPAQSVPAGANPVAADAGDINNDAIIDLVVANFDQITPTVTVLLGNGDATFIPETIALNEPPSTMLLTDIDVDGQVDLLFIQPNSARLGRITRNSDGSFAAPVNFVQLASGGSPRAVSLVDLNGDASQDLVMLATERDSVFCILRGQDSFLGTLERSVGGGPNAVVSLDINGDSLPDLVTSNELTRDISLLLSNP